MSGPGHGVVAAGHPLTAEAGAGALREGGNAVDAALAAMFASFASEPLLTGLGSGGYMLVAGAGMEPVVLDFFVQSPTHRRAADGASEAGQIAELLPIEVSFGDAVQLFHVGPASCGVYGAPAGACAAAARWGTLPLEQLVRPAVALARDGVHINAGQAYVAHILADLLRSTPESAQLWAPQGEILREGELLRNPELADALERLARDGAEPFYRGQLAAAVSDWLQARGGTITREDLAAYRAIERAPVRVPYRDRVILTNPPPSAGGTLLAYALVLLDREPPPATLRGIVDAMRAAQAERTPDFVSGLQQEGFGERFLGSRLGSTTHISVIDSNGMACSVTCTNGEGSGVIVPGTGIHLNNVMGEEDLNPHGFHRHPAGVRMPSMMAPTVGLRDGEVELVLGSAGSNRIRSALLQTIVAFVDHRSSASEAVNAPRVHFEDGILYAEPGIDLSELDEELPRVRFGALNLFFGGVQAALRREGIVSGAGDPRRGGVAVSA